MQLDRASSVLECDAHLRGYSRKRNPLQKRGRISGSSDELPCGLGREGRRRGSARPTTGSSGLVNRSEELPLQIKIKVIERSTIGCGASLARERSLFAGSWKLEPPAPRHRLFGFVTDLILYSGVTDSCDVLRLTFLDLTLYVR